MKKTLLLVSAVFSILNITAQTTQLLDTNNVLAGVNSKGLLFTNPTSGIHAFEVPKNSGNHSLNGVGIWVSGFDASMNLHQAVLNHTMSDFRPGPMISPILGTGTPYSSNWNKVWKITAEEINYHLANYTTLGYVPSPAIANWPTVGDPLFPAAVAPYFDFNMDGAYNPMAGDYPLIKGSMATFQVFNDDTLHPSGGLPIGLEIHCMTYSFGCTYDSALNNTIFVNYTVINHSTNTLDSTFIGLYADADIGDGSNDFIGCDVSRGMFYSYNGDSSDIDYDSILPVLGITILGGPYRDADGVDNVNNTSYPTAITNGSSAYDALGLNFGDGIPDNERLGLRRYIYHLTSGAPNPNMLGPSTGNEFYNYLNGHWLDGSNLLFGGAGYSGLSGVTTTLSDYAFIYDTDPYYWSTHGATVSPTWNEPTAGTSVGNRVSVGSMGPFTMNPGSYNEIDVAFTFARDYTQSHNPLAAMPILQTRVDTIRNYYINNNPPCGSFRQGFAVGIEENKDNQIEFDVYPNPVNEYLTLKLDKPDKNTNFILYNVMGDLIIANTRMNGTSTIDVSHLPNGIYYLEVSNETQQSTKKIIVNHH